jgi:hypothetical protein
LCWREKSCAPIAATSTFESSRVDSTIKPGAATCAPGFTFANRQNNIVMTDENKIIGDAFAIFVKLFIVILTVVRFFPIGT